MRKMGPWLSSACSLRLRRTARRWSRSAARPRGWRRISTGCRSISIPFRPTGSHAKKEGRSGVRAAFFYSLDCLNLADVEVEDDAGRDDRIDLEWIEVALPLGHLRLQIALNLNGDGIGRIVDVGAECLRLVIAGPASQVHVDRGGAGKYGSHLEGN